MDGFTPCPDSNYPPRLPPMISSETAMTGQTIPGSPPGQASDVFIAGFSRGLSLAITGESLAQFFNDQ
jgi:hypothetical protein